MPYIFWPLAMVWLKSSGGGKSLSAPAGCRIHPLLLRLMPSTVLSEWVMANTWRRVRWCQEGRPTWQPGREFTEEKTVVSMRQSGDMSTEWE